MNSYWLDSTKDLYIPFSSLENDITSDVCIIGGGLAGLTCGYLLSKRGLSCTILERDSICSHTSRKYYTEKLLALMVCFIIIFSIRTTIAQQKNI